MPALLSADAREGGSGRGPRPDPRPPGSQRLAGPDHRNVPRLAAVHRASRAGRDLRETRLPRLAARRAEGPRGADRTRDCEMGRRPLGRAGACGGGARLNRQDLAATLRPILDPLVRGAVGDPMAYVRADRQLAAVRHDVPDSTLLSKSLRKNLGPAKADKLAELVLIDGESS